MRWLWKFLKNIQVNSMSVLLREIKRRYYLDSKYYIFNYISHRFNKLMTSRYLIFIVMILLLDLFCYSYIITFCGIYSDSSKGWINGVITAVLIDIFIVFTIMAVVKALIRVIIRRYKSCKCLIHLENFFYLLDFI